jgi:tetratricopeptide (TPR) repeat protein
MAEVYRWKSASLWAMKRGPEALSAVDQYLAKGGRPTADVYRMRAQIRAWDHQFPAALGDFTQSLELQPHSATYAARGWVFLAFDDTPSALKDFEAALRLDKGNSEGYNGRGLIRVWQAQYGDALADVDAALRHGDAKTPALFWNAAHIYAQIARGLAVEPGSQNPMASAARAEHERKAVEMVKKAVEVAPEASAYWRANIAPDALLNPIRGRDDFQLLEKKFKGK